MASYGHSQGPPAGYHPQPVVVPAVYGAVPAHPNAAHGHSHTYSAPAGTFAPGTKIQVGNHRVVIQKYLSEGGFAHVYLVKLPSPVDGTDLAVLKRVAVPDKEALRGMRTEVETMKRLKGHRPIVTYIDSHASELRGGGYEVFLLMEFCNGGGLIDFMNTRLQHRLTEPEILNIFADVAEGVACMHYLRPPLLHRDIKVENVLINARSDGSRKKFKVCDFGSAAPPTPAPTSIVECRLMEEDVQKHTTLQYRAPEMVDVYRKQPINEKSDIWALGVLLYKLCYYTTPFEDQGQLAIMNASFRFPSHPIFSDRLKHLIASMLREHQQARPNIYQVLSEACAMQGRRVPITDIYAEKASSETPRPVERPVSDKPASAPTVGATFAPSASKQQFLPEIVPMRRGRPLPGNQVPPKSSGPSPSPAAKGTSGDPFAALDKRASRVQADELSTKFPTLDEFTLLHDHGTKFNFDEQLSPPSTANDGSSPRVAERLADEVFSRPQPQIQAQSGPTSHPVSLRSRTSSPSKQQIASPPTSIPSHVLSAPSKASEPPRPKMVSQGTMTTPPLEAREYPPVHRFPPADQARPSSLSPWTGDSPSRQAPAATRTPSFQGQSGHLRQPSSSRPSLEAGRPSLESLEPPKSRALPSRPRPASTHLESNIEFLRERENTKYNHATRTSPNKEYDITQKSLPPEPVEESSIPSNVEFLRALETEGRPKHLKRGSLSSLSGTKSMLAGKFGDVFKKFEGSNTGGAPSARTPSPLIDIERRELAPIPGSEPTDNQSDEGGDIDQDGHGMNPEARREMERRRLSAEEKRVAAAAAEYKNRVSSQNSSAPVPPPKSIGGVPRAVSIQNKVERLLEESQRSSANVARTAEGYGKYSDAAVLSSQKQPEPPRKQSSTSLMSASPHTGSGTGMETSRPVVPPKPSGPPKPGPKPVHLNTVVRVNTEGMLSSSSPTKVNSSASNSFAEPMLAKMSNNTNSPVKLDMSMQQKEDYVREFQKRYPSLSSLEMVETEITEPNAAASARRHS